MANNFFLNCENPTPLCTTLRAIGAVGTPVHLCSIEDWGCPRLFLEDRDSNDVTHYNYLILHCTFFYFNQRFDFPIDLWRRLAICTGNIQSLSKTQKKICREFSRNIYKNSRESRIQKSRERNPNLFAKAQGNGLVL